MKNKSESWRFEGDQIAFDPFEWSFKAKGILESAKLLIKEFDKSSKTASFEHMLVLPTAEFLVCLAIELISKSCYLKHATQKKDKIYTHSVVELFDQNFFNENQLKLMKHAERFVLWAGRYPTPKWTKEKFKSEYDVKSKISNGVEHINAQDIPNASSRPKLDELIKLYEYIAKHIL